MKRLLIYSHDTFGLGNMRRMTSIAEHLVQSHPELTILMLSGSNALPAFGLPDRIDYIKLPCLVRDTQGNYGSKSLAMDLQKIIELRGNIILSAMLDFRPDMILVDKKPFGVCNELQPVLEMIARRVRPPKLVLLLRDILDDAGVTRDIWQRNGYHDAIENFYDAVLVVGDAAIYELGKECGFPQSTRDRMRYCGYIRKPTARSETQISNRPMVLVTPGGGEDGAQLVDTYIESLANLKRDAYESLIILGPDLADGSAKELQARAIDIDPLQESLRVRRFTRRMSYHMQKAQVLVTMGGYNTVSEGLSLDKSMIVVPRTEPGKEQEIRTECLTRLGHIRSIHPTELTASRLSSAVRESLACPTREHAPLNFDGLLNVDRALCDVTRECA